MASNKWYQCTQVEKVCPEFKEIIPFVPGDTIALSMKGNLKFSHNGNIEVLLAIKRYRPIIEAIKAFENSAIHIPSSFDIEKRISIEEIKSLFPQLDIPVGCKDFFIRKSEIKADRLWYTKTNDYGLLLEERYQCEYKENLHELIDLLTEDDFSKYKPIIENNYKLVHSQLLEALKNHNREYHNIVKFRIKELGPTILLLDDNNKGTKIFSRMADEHFDKMIAKRIEKLTEHAVKQLNERNFKKQLNIIKETYLNQIKIKLKENPHLTNIHINFIDTSAENFGLNIAARTPEKSYIYTRTANESLDTSKYIKITVEENTKIENYSIKTSAFDFVSQYANETMLTLSESGWFIKKTKKDSLPEVKLKKELSCIVSQIIETRLPIYCGPQIDCNSINVLYDIKKNEYYASSYAGDIRWCNDKIIYKESKPFKELKHEIKLKKYENAIKYYKENSNQFIRNYIVSYKDGDGMLYGSTVLEVENEDIKFLYTWNTCSYQTLTEWKKNTIKNLKEIKTRYNLEKKLSNERKIVELGEFGGNFLAHDIIEFVKKNEDYITANAVVDYMRGMKQKFGGYIFETSVRGKYNYIDGDTMKSYIRRMIRFDLFREEDIKGTYGWFSILKITPKSSDIPPLGDFCKNNIKVIKNKVANNEKINDVEAEKFFTYITNKEKHSSKDYISLLNLLRYKSFICAYIDEYISFMKTMPEDVKELIEMKKMISTDKFETKIYLLILKKEKKSKTTAEAAG